MFFLTLAFSLLLSFTINVDYQAVILVQFFAELPVLVEQVKRNNRSSNINPLEYLHRKLNDSLNQPFHEGGCYHIETSPLI